MATVCPSFDSAGRLNCIDCIDPLGFGRKELALGVSNLDAPSEIEVITIVFVRLFTSSLLTSFLGGGLKLLHVNGGRSLEATIEAGLLTDCGRKLPGKGIRELLTRV